MDTSFKKIWDSALELIKPDISPTSFNTWFLKIKPINYVNNTYYFLSENEFEKGILESRHIPLITNALAEVTGKPGTVKIVLKEEDAMISPENTQPNTSNSFVDDNISSHQNNSMNPKYTFDSFVIGENNRFAHAACVAVSEAPSERYNPLFIYGGVGLGKTHLMQAIGHYILSYAPNKKVVYVSCEKFTNDFIDAIQNKTNIAFRNKYRNADILLIDDIQFLAKKEGTQEEFFHTFNTLQQENKQIVISSDRPPKEIPTLEERLRSRFESGLITDIYAPNFETRIAIIRKKAESFSDEIPNEVLSFIADSIHSNIRELEGALTTVFAYSKLHNAPINIESAKNALKDIFRKKEDIVITSEYIKEVTAKYFNITVEDMNSKKRTRSISLPRQVAMYITRDITDLSLPRIGEEFGGRDHSTVIHACQKITEDMATNTDFKNLILRIQREINGN
ncbi:chromosomal replication initiator protein DnaA [Acetobacterium tundrae]|uniref:Chromosomal replication initiator protein DnaA n=1 Tax=Acetobacterium tundrae TaxID=132932 RepID=A0ABR6WN92_9FIRM|nr:chromosomal replication initiator protein DnaA [Acetobacterium tundrae]MBC3797766.1 chromosomal replication initiator protein DnaA [Acetobacterium tundrae]